MRHLTGCVLTIGLTIALTACTTPPTSLVAAPPADAPPAQVAQAFIDALNARDDDLVHTLATDDYADHLDETWLDHGYLTEAKIGSTHDDAGEGTRFDGQDTASVELSFVPEQADSSMQNGSSITWSVLLVEIDGSWRVFDMGAA